MKKRILYNKLVRDNIPQIIEEDGKSCDYEILSDEEYIKKLDDKLDEEIAEYHKDANVSELADIIEVIYALARANGYSIEELEKIRIKKKVKNGGFDKRILLKEVYE